MKSAGEPSTGNLYTRFDEGRGGLAHWLAPSSTLLEAGRNLAELHLGYENCEEYPLVTKFSGTGEPQAKHFKIGTKKMKFADAEKSVLIVNDHIRLENIPAEAHHYVVNGRTPLEWFIDRYRIKTDRRSGILNDPNGWFDTPRDLINAFRRIVQVSVETVRIVGGLHEPFEKGSREGEI